MKLASYQFYNGQWSDDFDSDLDSENTLLVAFGASRFRGSPGPLMELTEAFPKAKVMGCSTAGEIWQDSVLDASISVAVARLESTEIRSAVHQIQDVSRSREAGHKIGETLSGDGLRGILVLSDGLQVNGSELTAGLTEVVGEKAPVVGGMAGDGDRFEKTWVLANGELSSGWVTAIGIYGENARLGHGSRGGWDHFGPERTVTRSKGNILYELDGGPALTLYKQYLGALADGLPAAGLLFPLFMSGNGEGDQGVVRTILSVDEEEQTLTFAGDLPEGERVRLMRANFDRLISGAAEAALLTATEERKGEPTLSLAISCVGRRLVLKDRTEDEVEAVLEEMPKDTIQIGFYSYGEFSPHVGSGGCALHNQTMTLSTLYEV